MNSTGEIAERARALYMPSEWGQRFHALKVDEALGAGSAGPGKTTVGIADPLEQIIVEHQRCADERHPFYHPWGTSTGWALFLRRTMPMLAQTIVKAMRLFLQLDPGAKWDRQSSTCTFSSGYRWQAGHCKDKDDYIAYYGNDYTHLFFDELIQFEKNQYVQLKSRVRSDDPVLRNMLKIRAATNPMVITEGEDFFTSDPFWVREYFIEPYKKIEPYCVPRSKDDTKILVKRVKMEDGTTEKVTRIFLPATLADNPSKEFRRDYERRLKDQPQHTQNALFYGDWYSVAGAFYSDHWNPSLHICDPFKIPASWFQFRSMDWGFKKHGCIGWYALDPEGTLWKFHEYTFRLKHDDQVAAQVKRIETRFSLWNTDSDTSKISGPADTQLWEGRGDSGGRGSANVRNKAQVFADLGVTWFPADKKDRAGNAQRLIKRLDDHGHGTWTPGIVFFRTCVQTLSTIPATPTDPKDSEVPLDTANDHWHDETLYACAFASLRDGEEDAPKDTTTYDDEAEDSEDDREYGRDGYGIS